MVQSRLKYDFLIPTSPIKVSNFSPCTIFMFMKLVLTFTVLTELLFSLKAFSHK